MTNEEYHFQNILQYNRKTYKNRNGTNPEVYTSRRADTNEDLLDSPRSDRVTLDSPVGCSCEIDPDGEIVSILRKKCPVIELAQRQLNRLLDESDKYFCDNRRCCRSVCDFIALCKEVISNQNILWSFFFLFFLIIIILMFFLGIILGSASCGTCYRKFNSPLFTCIENYFTYDSNYITSKENLRGIT